MTNDDVNYLRPVHSLYTRLTRNVHSLTPHAGDVPPPILLFADGPRKNCRLRVREQHGENGLFRVPRLRLHRGVATGAQVLLVVVNGGTDRHAGPRPAVEEPAGLRVEGLEDAVHRRAREARREQRLAEVALPEGKPIGDFPFAEVSVAYKTVEGTAESLAPVLVSTRVVDAQAPVSTVSDATVLRSSTMLGIARSLSRIGTLYYGSQAAVSAKPVPTAADAPVTSREAMPPSGS